MGNIKILNLKEEMPSKQYDFIIDNTTPLGNRYYLTKAVNRESAVSLFEKYLSWCFNNPNEKDAKATLKYLHQIEGAYKKNKKVRLFCWCAPLKCHGKIIKQYLKRE